MSFFHVGTSGWHYLHWKGPYYPKDLSTYEIEGRHTPKILTADFVYVRLHGPKGAYQGSYSSNQLDKWAKDFLRWEKQGVEVFCYFDNDEKGYAPKNALKLKAKLS